MSRKSNIPTWPTPLRQYSVVFSDGRSRFYRGENVEQIKRIANVTARREGIRVVSIA